MQIYAYSVRNFIFTFKTKGIYMLFTFARTEIHYGDEDDDHSQFTNERKWRFLYVNYLNTKIAF